jgi:hypothetical protein
MKKLITFCLIMVTTFVMHAQKKELNKEETVAYIEKLYKANYYQVSSVSLDANILQIEYEGKSGKTEMIRTEIKNSPFGIHQGDEYFFIEHNNNRFFIQFLQTKTDADRMKKALEHLQKLIQTEGSDDPFGN